MTVAPTQKDHVAAILAARTPKPGDLPSMFMGVPITAFSRDELLGMVTIMAEQQYHYMQQKSAELEVLSRL